MRIAGSKTDLGDGDRTFQGLDGAGEIEIVELCHNGRCAASQPLFVAFNDAIALGLEGNDALTHRLHACELDSIRDGEGEPHIARGVANIDEPWAQA